MGSGACRGAGRSHYLSIVQCTVHDPLTACAFLPAQDVTILLCLHQRPLVKLDLEQDKMGWWPFSSDSRGDAIRAGTAIPNRQERAVCWAARDTYFACLDANSILDANKDAAAAKRACPRENEAFERDCAVEWVKYFKQWRVADIQKKRRLEELRKQGAQEMEVTSTFADGPSGAAKSKEDIQGLLDKKKR